MTLVQSPITANWVTKQMNSHTFCRPKNSSFGHLNFELSQKTLKSLYLLIFEDVFEALLNVTNWLISSVKTKRVSDFVVWTKFVTWVCSLEKRSPYSGWTKWSCWGICLASSAGVKHFSRARSKPGRLQKLRKNLTLILRQLFPDIILKKVIINLNLKKSKKYFIEFFQNFF